MTPQTLLLTALDQLYAQYREKLQECKSHFSEKAVHDLRVAVRRFLAFNTILKALFKKRYLKKLQKSLKKQLDALDELRDVQVILIETQSRLETLPGLAPFKQYLVKQEKQLTKLAAQDVEQVSVEKFDKRIKKARAAICDSKVNPNLLEQLLQIIDQCYAKVIKQKKYIDHQNPNTIHLMRIVFKKFRYMVEIICPMFPDYPQQHLKSMHDYQALMGEVHDVDVMLDRVMKFTAAHKMVNSPSIIDFYESRHQLTVAAYINKMDAITGYWRSDPRAPFPWHKPGKTGRKIKTNKVVLPGNHS